jgi:hypothetical protein
VPASQALEDSSASLTAVEVLALIERLGQLVQGTPRMCYSASA